MTRHYSAHLSTALKILGLYNGSMPLSVFLKQYFSANRQHGSTDRRQISHLLYSFYRLGKANLSVSAEERICTSLFLTSTGPNDLLGALRSEFNDRAHLSLEEKMDGLGSSFNIQDLFPWKDALSNGMDHELFCKSFLVQPDLFLRIRPGFEKEVQIIIHQQGWPAQWLSTQTVSLPNGTQLDKILDTDRQVVVQDFSSQQTGGFMESALRDSLWKNGKWWDCCAASGGKTLMMADLLGSMDITVSDIRESVLANLARRFQKAGMSRYRSMVVDLENAATAKKKIQSLGRFHVVMADLPCTGSGTWSRTPEQMYFFEEGKLGGFAERQQRILSSVIPTIQNGGHLFYITCSVFRKENEDMVEWIAQNSSLHFHTSKLITGYMNRADTMFIAHFTA